MDFKPQLTLTIFVLYAISTAYGHGRLLEPPSRASMWRFKNEDPALIPYANDILPNYGDNQLYCGGRNKQIQNNGSCGVCGDPYDGVKEHEAGGTYALGIITRNYQQGQVINVTVQITAPHKGYFEFRLCPWNDIHTPVTHQCLNENLLRFADGDTKWYLPKVQPTGMHALRLQLPSDVTCTQCLLQWKYKTGNHWGVDESGRGLGHGPQEEFYGCADVAILGSGEGDVTIPSTSNPSSLTQPILGSGEGDVTIPSTSNPSPSTIRSTTPPVFTNGRITCWSTPENTEETERPTQSPGGAAYEDVDCNTVAMMGMLGQPIFRNCQSFYVCAFRHLDAFQFDCPPGTVCDPDDGVCKRTCEVPQCKGY